ncbi:MAG TPA: MerC domain-containing protein [Flavitalea sp.]|nr:MerC domain-containing protein [Flavitalea sp.]
MKVRNNILFATLLHIELLEPYLCSMSFRINWDAIGITTSLACAIHCAVLPMILSTLPIFGINIVDNVVFEYFMIVLAFSIGCHALWHGYRKHHHSFTPLIIFCFGISLLFAKQLWHAYQLWLLPFAVILIISAHLLNYRSCRVHNHAHSDDCNH